MEQILRDSRIATLYEGTTGIQALDLVGRKVLMDKFKQLNVFTGEMLSFAGTVFTLEESTPGQADAQAGLDHYQTGD